MRRIWKFIPLVIMIAVIILLTFQDAQGTLCLSEGFRNWIIGLCENFDLYNARGWVDSAIRIRRLGHVLEYLAFGVAAAICIGKKRYTLLLCVCFSFADQIIKIYVPGRHFDPYDLPFDAVGYAAGILLGDVFAGEKSKQMEKMSDGG